MKHITDDDLTLLYYGEHENPDLAAEVARSPELSQRFEALSAELLRIDELMPPARDEDYGSDVWRQIESRLTPEDAPAGSRWKTWLSSMLQPRFSLAGALSLVLVASLAFMLGRQANQPHQLTPATTDTQAVAVTPGLDTERLLTSSVSGHLDQLNLALTQFANEPRTSSAEAERATDMLVANRLYRKAAADQGKHQLAQFLAELEPLLIELAYEAHKASPHTLNRMQQEVRDTLLFRIRVMNQQLKQPQIST
jgi:hypothetical protein